MTDKKKRGRPSKAELAANTKGNRGVMGRPPGDAAKIKEYTARLLTNPKSALVIEEILNTALDSESKSQAACMKIVADRLLPASYFAKDTESRGIGGITISINNAAPTEVAIDGEVVDES